MNSMVENPSRSWPVEIGREAAQRDFFEPFVDEHVVARFLQISPRKVVEMARKKELPAHPIGRRRRKWRFRMSEIDAHFSLRDQTAASVTMSPAVPGAQERKKHLG